ncbi:DUF1998 domain-containing protein [Mesobacillus jeotgali]|uniref:DUF1998 domain-containing protein n=1 Tax=Mesobacillus jeotgali TaxID=129985 RepID=A0ABY9VC35_9BACI|nr:DUF1998 domain-containing protein [Mesobacillus jeotgali]WNF21315.1 DUF1998 domain-containing protein [Mesobacillus jeotgali]
MVEIPVRRAQLIAPFGPGALTVTKEGVSVICAGVDHWYKDYYGTYENTDLDHYKIREWRLERLLNVSHFRLPPDFRVKGQSDLDINLYLNVPFLRFPQWHYCRFCGRLEKFKLHVSSNRLECPSCKKKGNSNHLVQVPYVAMCEHGHLQDFPWREWVHAEVNPNCKQPMYLESTGGTGLSSMVVKCECGISPRSLMRVTSASPNGTTFLSENLDKNKDIVFTCQGKRPWLGTEDSEPCSNHLRATLRNASNLYFAKVKSAIYIPGDNKKEVEEVIDIFQTETFQTFLGLLNEVQLSNEKKVEKLRNLAKRELKPYSDSLLKEALSRLDAEFKPNELEINETRYEHQLRYEEYKVLTETTDQHNLKIKSFAMKEYKKDVSDFFSDVFLVEKLKETRVLAGFTRVISENGLSTDELKNMLRQTNLSSQDENWLPAYEVYGEGIFLKLDEKKLCDWEQNTEVLKRIKPLQDKFDDLYSQGRIEYKEISPRYVLIHTLAHLLINQLTFDCGYSTAALRERLYVSNHTQESMNGLLIYTAAGDSDGTMGGLVKMAKPGYLEAVIKKAIENARWCTADPVCMEIGSQGGQGPDSANLAACHNCTLVPETACEEFNRFLDRALIIGDLQTNKIGFFN